MLIGKGGMAKRHGVRAVRRCGGIEQQAGRENQQRSQQARELAADQQCEHGLPVRRRRHDADPECERRAEQRDMQRRESQRG